MSFHKILLTLVIFVDRMYPIEFEIKSTTDDARSASYLDLHLETDREGRLISHCEFTVCI